MTQGQRNMHVVMWLVLGPIAGLCLALAVLWRPPTPVHDGPLPGASDARETIYRRAAVESSDTAEDSP